MSTLKILFEPWNLGDALIAASIARTDPGQFQLACNSNWHEVLRLASGDALQLLPLDLPYVWRTGKRYFSLGDAVSLRERFGGDQGSTVEVISIRGDLRDWVAARRIFPGGRFRFTGWLRFCARKTALLDFPFRHGYMPVQNRYRDWAAAAGIPYSLLETTFTVHPEKRVDAPVVIHVGAQWRSKQYPHVAELVEFLENSGHRVEILAGPDDPLPQGLTADRVQRPKWTELVVLLRSARYVVSNDSGPMHLAAFLGCRTIALSRCSNIQEWLPPGVIALSSPLAPHGYRPVSDYWSDQILSGWPAAAEVIASVNAEDGQESKSFQAIKENITKR